MTLLDAQSEKSLSQASTKSDWNQPASRNFTKTQFKGTVTSTDLIFVVHAGTLIIK